MGIIFGPRSSLSSIDSVENINTVATSSHSPLGTCPFPSGCHPFTQHRYKILTPITHFGFFHRPGTGGDLWVHDLSFRTFGSCSCGSGCWPNGTGTRTASERPGRIGSPAWRPINSARSRSERSGLAPQPNTAWDGGLANSPTDL